jgi:uncharacterized protein (DUF433 family)
MILKESLFFVRVFVIFDHLEFLFSIIEDYMNNRIEITPEICHGKPVIRGTRIMVRNILGSLAGGDSIHDVLQSYPELTLADIKAAIAYAIELVDDTQITIKMPA